MIYPRKIITVDADVAQEIEQQARQHAVSARDYASALLRVAMSQAYWAEIAAQLKPTPRGRPKGTMGKLRRMSE